MMVTERNIYHPFVNKSLGFLINTKDAKYSEEFLTDVSLYWQPVQDPKFSIPVLVIELCIIVAGSFIHHHLWKMLKREDENLVSHILKAYVVIQMTFWPFMTFLNQATSFIYPFSFSLLRQSQRLQLHRLGLKFSWPIMGWGDFEKMRIGSIFCHFEIDNTLLGED